MYPILFQIEAFQLFGFEVGLISLFSHGVFQAIGFMIAILWFLKIAQKNHLHLEFIADHFFSLIFWSVVGARLGYVYVFFARYEQNPLSILYFWDGGFLMWAGVVAFLITFFYHCSKQKEKIGQWLDVIVPAAVIAFIFDSFGAFLGGEQYGKPTELPWGIVFENPEVPFTIPVHPVQLYLLCGLLLVLIIIQVLHRRMMRESLVGLIGLAMFAFVAFFTEYFRGDEMILYFNHRFTQILQIIVLIFSISLIFLNKRRNAS
ncbi:MAG: prolipoprotein diacylglyceryl transferase [Candidatus Altimarinota bacterium]